MKVQQFREVFVINYTKEKEKREGIEYNEEEKKRYEDKQRRTKKYDTFLRKIFNEYNSIQSEYAFLVRSGDIPKTQLDRLNKKIKEQLDTIKDVPEDEEEIDFLISLADSIKDMKVTVEFIDHSDIVKNIEDTFKKLKDDYSPYVSTIIYCAILYNIRRQFSIHIAEVEQDRNETVSEAIASQRRMQYNKYLRNFKGKTYPDYLKYCQDLNIYPIREDTFDKLILFKRKDGN